MNAHENGAQRHGADWAVVNQIAVDVLTGSNLKPWNRDVKATVPLILLRVLDRLKLNAGLVWNTVTKIWEPAREEQQTIVTESWNGNRGVICFRQVGKRNLLLISGTFDSFAEFQRLHPGNYVRFHMHEWLAVQVRSDIKKLLKIDQ